jgi:hypothetical protein
MCCLLIACAVLSIRMFRRKERKALSRATERPLALAGASVGMPLTFRAELMPGKEAVERTFIVERVLDNGRVELIGLAGQHTMTEFEHVP